jgi:3-oxoacyl-[acyl-carrier protein] reductase
MSKRALITGGSRGIGQQIAQVMSARGFEVVVPKRQELNLESLESIEKYFATDRQFDILVNNAGINFISPLAEIATDQWSQMLSVNLTAPMKLVQKVIPHMQKSKWGRIVNISSIFSNITREGRASYSASKSGLNGLTRSAAVELGKYGILVNAVCPGYVETQLTHQNNSPADIERILKTIPLGRMADPSEIAELVEFLCSDRNSYITGQMITADGGFSIQ